MTQMGLGHVILFEIFSDFLKGLERQDFRVNGSGRAYKGLNQKDWIYSCIYIIIRSEVLNNVIRY
jgi:hypothetical protein